MLAFFRSLGIAGSAGLVASLALAILLVMQKGETRHWKKQSNQFEQLYRGEQTAHAETIANYRAAAEVARAADRANAERVATEQRAINERTTHDLQKRLADARVLADRLRRQPGAAPANPGGTGATAVPRLPDPSEGSPQAAGQDRLPDADRLTATEQAIQLDEIIKWVKRQVSIDTNGRQETSNGADQR